MRPEEFMSELARLYRGLDELNYYEFLGLRPGCDYVAIREAFHTRAQRFHPDRFALIAGEITRDQAYAVYKRMTEAYNSLLDPSLRSEYDAARVRGQRRLPEAVRAKRLAPDERQISNTLARIYLRAARAKLTRGDVRGAWIDVQLGLGLENAPPLMAMLEEIRANPRARDEIGREL